MKIVVSEKSGKSYSLEIDKEKEVFIYGKKIGDEIAGDDLGLAGYKLKITGGSDIAGFPMRYDIDGNRKVKVLMKKGPGLRLKGKGKSKKIHKGAKYKKTVRGNTIGEGIVAVNLVVSQPGPVPLEELLGKKKEEGENN